MSSYLNILCLSPDKTYYSRDTINSSMHDVHLLYTLKPRNLQLMSIMNVNYELQWVNRNSTCLLCIVTPPLPYLAVGLAPILLLPGLSDPAA